jgi:predicted RNase H-like HicB family nuclease
LKAAVDEQSSTACGGGVNFKIQFEREEDGRCIAEISELPGVMAYGSTQAEAAVEALALRLIADRIEAETSDRRRSALLRREQVAQFNS